MAQLIAKAPAKINLGLWIHQRRSDGFHSLSTIFQEVPLYDTLTFDSNFSGKKFHCDHFPQDENLAYQAWTLMEQHSQKKLHGYLHIDKQIPDQAGLGGGSSDAATTLKLLNSIYQLHVSHDDLLHLALKLGSDVPFFIHSGCQLGQSRGEKLKALKKSYQGLILIAVPTFGLSTKSVFQQLSQLSPSDEVANILAKSIELGTPDWQVDIHNDLLESALKIEPQLKNFMAQIRTHTNRDVHLSGSGSCCYSLLNKIIDPPSAFSGRLLCLCDMKLKKIIWKISS